MLTAEEVADLLGLEPHPEGGRFRETFRDGDGHAGRGHSTAIYFLLRAGEVSRWHRVDAAEVWHWYAGSPLALSIVDRRRQLTRVVVGNDLLRGERPQAVVPAGDWQQAESLGAWTLAGCTVAPGFSFAGFDLPAAGFDPLAPPADAPKSR